MLQLSQKLYQVPVLSLRTGGPIAVTTAPLINPNNLKIEGFYCQDKFSKKELVLVVQDIREQLEAGFVVNDHEVLVEPDELVRLEKIMALQFELINKPVYTVSRERIGKIADYAIDFSSFYIVKLYAAQSLIKSFTGGSLVIDRTQINEITPTKIIIEDIDNRAVAPATASL